VCVQRQWQRQLGWQRGAQLELPCVEAGRHVQVLNEEAVQVLVQSPQLGLGPVARPAAACCPTAHAARAAGTAAAARAAAVAGARLELAHDVCWRQRLGAAQQQREGALPAVRGEEAHVVSQEAVEVVPLDEGEDVRMPRRELQEELEGRLQP